MNNSLPDKLSTLCDPAFQEAIDKTIEQHRLNGNEIAVSDRKGNVLVIQPKDIIPLAEKVKQRQNCSTADTII